MGRTDVRHEGILQAMISMDFRELRIWQKAKELTKACYVITSQFPKEEVYGLTSQIRRAAVSIPSNIAEGSQRTTQKDFSHFVLIAKGSLAELQTQLSIAYDLNYMPEKAWKSLDTSIDELHRMLYSFHAKLES